MKIDLVIDATCRPHQGESEERYTVLERLIARGEPFALDATDLETCLHALFDISRAQPLPAAALSLLGDGADPGEDYWVRLDPVHLRAERSRLLLVTLPPGDIAPHEADALRAALAAHLAQEGYALHAAQAQRWYLRSPRPLDLLTRPPQRCAGTLDEHHLPAGADGAAMRRLITEAQMLLHELPVNEAREAEGKLAVNGVWPWGGGAMIAIARSGYTHASSDDALVRGLARASGAEAGPLPDDVAGWAAQLRPESSFLLVCSTADTPLGEIERHWLRPLVETLDRDPAAELRLMLIAPERTLARSLTRRNLRRWWRRSRPLHDA